MRKLPSAAIAAFLIGSVVASGITVADAADRRVRIINQTSESIYYLYASRTTINDWEEDLLGDQVIPPGRSVLANIDDGSGTCYYDLKAVTRSGRVAYKWNVNVCTTVSWTITD